jgi:hypothetical protein
LSPKAIDSKVHIIDGFSGRYEFFCELPALITNITYYVPQDCLFAATYDGVFKITRDANVCKIEI